MNTSDNKTSKICKILNLHTLLSTSLSPYKKAFYYELLQKELKKLRNNNSEGEES